MTFFNQCNIRIPNASMAFMNPSIHSRNIIR